VEEAGLRSSSGLATTLALAAILAFAAIVAGLATTLAFTIVLALAVVSAAIEMHRLCAGANNDGRLSGADVLGSRSRSALSRAGQQARERRDSQHAAGGTDQFGLLRHDNISSVLLYPTASSGVLSPTEIWYEPATGQSQSGLGPINI